MQKKKSSTTLNWIRILYRNSLVKYYPTNEIDSIFGLVLEHVTQIPFHEKIKQNDYLLNEEQQNQTFDILDRLKKNEPIQYILGKAHFYDLDIEVNPNVLIPRQETELLVHEIIGLSPSEEWNTLLDIGTGSGCIAISLKKNLPEKTVFAMDFSEEALEVAQRNALMNKTDIQFFKDTILEPTQQLEQKYDLIVSNPPYVRESEKVLMHSNVKDFEPVMALFVADDSPLLFYEAIARFASSNLTERGSIAIEINEALAEATTECFKIVGFQNCRTIKDLNNKDRILIIKR